MIVSEKNIIAPEDCSAIFTDFICPDCEIFNFKNFDTSHTIDMSHMFVSAEQYYDVNTRFFFGPNFTTEAVESFEEMFSNVNSLRAINLTNFTFSGNCNTNKMFGGCSNLEKIFVNKESYIYPDWAQNIGLHAKVTVPGIYYEAFNEFANKEILFKYATSTVNYKLNKGNNSCLIFDHYTSPGEYVDINGYNIVQNYKPVWFYFSGETDRYPAETAFYMDCCTTYGYEYCFLENEQIRLYITMGSGLLYEALVLSDLPIYILNEDKDVVTTGMFENFSFLNAFPNNYFESIILKNFDVSLLKNMNRMFYNVKFGYGQILDLSSFGQFEGLKLNNNYREMDLLKGMFCNCSSLTRIYVEDGFAYPSDGVIDTTSFEEGTFAGCTSLVGGSGVAYQDGMCFSDMATTQDGYFTNASQRTEVAPH